METVGQIEIGAYARCQNGKVPCHVPDYPQESGTPSGNSTVFPYNVPTFTDYQELHQELPAAAKWEYGQSIKNLAASCGGA